MQTKDGYLAAFRRDVLRRAVAAFALKPADEAIAKAVKEFGLVAVGYASAQMVLDRRYIQPGTRTPLEKARQRRSWRRRTEA